MDIKKQTMSVEGYTRYFVRKIVKDERYHDSSELQLAGHEFFNLLERFCQKGEREDVRTPFKIMKDEFMQEWKTSNDQACEELARRMFGVLDVVHEECQSNVQNFVDGMNISQTILEEFRLRIAKMVVGDTWKEALPLRIEALKHMCRYRNRELARYSTKHLTKSLLKNRAKHLTVKKLKRTVIGHATSSWTAVFNDLLLTSGSRLAPLLFAILNENQILEEQLLQCLESKPAEKESYKGEQRSSTPERPTLANMNGKTDINALSLEGERSAPQYYRTLNSDLNAKLQMLKQKGLVEGLSRFKDTTSEDSGGYYPQSFRNNEHEVNTPRTEDNDDSNVQRSLTPFSDEVPPPWSVMDGSSVIMDGALSDGDLSQPLEALKFDVDKPSMYLSQSNSAKLQKPESEIQKLKKSASYQVSGNQPPTFTFETSSNGPPPFSLGLTLQKTPPKSVTNQRLFEELDPLIDFKTNSN